MPDDFSPSLFYILLLYLPSHHLSFVLPYVVCRARTRRRFAVPCVELTIQGKIKQDLLGQAACKLQNKLSWRGTHNKGIGDSPTCATIHSFSLLPRKKARNTLHDGCGRKMRAIAFEARGVGRRTIKPRCMCSCTRTKEGEGNQHSLLFALGRPAGCRLSVRTNDEFTYRKCSHPRLSACKKIESPARFIEPLYKKKNN